MKRKTKVLLTVIGTAACVTTAVAVVKVFDYPIAAAQLSGLVAEAKREGIPFTSEEVDSSKNPDPSVNTLGLFAMFGSTGSLAHLTSLPNALLAGRTRWEAAAEQLRQHQRVLDELVRVSKLPRAWPRKDWDMAPYVQLTELSHVRMSVRALSSRAQLAAYEGRVKEAAADLIACRRLAEHCRGEGLSGYLVKISTDSQVNRMLEYCMAKAKDVGELRSYQDALPDEASYDLRSLLQREAFSYIATTRNLQLFGGVKAMSSGALNRFESKDLQRSGDPRGLVEQAYLARGLQHYIDCLHVVQSSTVNLVKTCQRLSEVSLRHRDTSRGLSRELLKVFPPDYASLGVTSENAVAEARCLRALYGLLEIRLSSGKFPEAMPSTIDIKDPYDMAALRYRTEDDTVRVWSVGPDYEDNDGISQREIGRMSSQEKPKPYDVVATYPPIRPRRMLSQSPTVN